LGEDARRDGDRTHPVRPRHAASLIVLRWRGARAELLMGRRAPRNRFMPDVYVFPGGGVSPGDGGRPVASPLRPAVHRALRAASRAPSPRAVASAAVRETHEETGLRLGSLVGGELRADLSKLHYLARAITPSYQSTRYHARFFLAERGDLHGAVRSNGELLDLHWVTLEQARELPIVDVTELVLDQVALFVAGARRSPPLIYYRNRKPILRR
jgi:8-oxo-dGTP pyrophosphatase MutT (NUDIX family)